MVSSRDTAPDNQILALPSSALALWNRFDCVHALFACACGWVIRRRCGSYAVAMPCKLHFHMSREWPCSRYAARVLVTAHVPSSPCSPFHTGRLLDDVRHHDP